MTGHLHTINGHVSLPEATAALRQLCLHSELTDTLLTGYPVGIDAVLVSKSKGRTDGETCRSAVLRGVLPLPATPVILAAPCLLAYNPARPARSRRCCTQVFATDES